VSRDDLHQQLLKAAVDAHLERAPDRIVDLLRNAVVRIADAKKNGDGMAEALTGGRAALAAWEEHRGAKSE